MTQGTQDSLIGAGSSIAGSIISMIGEKKRNKRAFNQQKELMEISQKNQMELNAQGKKLALEQWKDTNYGAQVEEMDKAGINPGLLYGMSGGGGVTASVGSGGSSASGSAPQQQAMDINAMTGAQIGLMLAQTNKTNAEAENLKGTDRENTVADTELTKMQTENEEIKRNIGNMTMESVISGIAANANKAISEARSADTEADVKAETKEAQVSKIEAEAKVEAFKLAVMKSGIKVNEATMQKMIEDVKIGKFNANINAEYQGIDKVTGSVLNKIMGDVEKMMGAEGEHTKTVK